MHPRSGKHVAGAGALALLWIVVYWAWSPSADRRPAAPEMSGAPRAVARVVTPAAAASPPVRTQDAPDPSSPAIAVRPPEFIAHTVEEGETLASISARYYGTESHAGAISRANPLASLTPLRVGREIRIPRDPTNIQGRPLRPAHPDPPGLDREYTVREGDSLSKIALLMYGDAGRAEALFIANRDQLTNRDTLRPGQRLRVPPLPTQDQPPASDRP